MNWFYWFLAAYAIGAIVYGVEIWEGCDFGYWVLWVVIWPISKLLDAIDRWTSDE